MCLSSTKYAFKSWYITNLWLIKYDMFLHKICICSLFYGLFRSQIMHDTPIVIHDITNISILSHWNMRIFLYYWYQRWCLGNPFILLVSKYYLFCYQEQSSSCQNSVSQPSNEDQKNNLTQQSMAASTQLSSSVSSTVEKMDGKSVVSRSRLNSTGKWRLFKIIRVLLQ